MASINLRSYIFHSFHSCVIVYELFVSMKPFALNFKTWEIILFNAQRGRGEWHLAGPQ